MKSDLNPRITILEPMRVASCRVVGKQPEIEAFRRIAGWAQQADLLNAEGTRFFGFDNPAPSSDGDEYGYEVWMTTEADLEETESVRMKQFPGGKYAVIRSSLADISRSWRDLVEWREESKYGEGTHQCLEEHLNLPIGKSAKAVEIDLYIPLAE